TFKSAGLARIRALADSPEKASQLPKILAELGVRLVVIEPLPRSLIDGAAFWMDEQSPVIAISLRYDRIDWFWFTLAHECAHILNGHEESLDNDLVGEARQQAEDKPDYEQQ